MKGITRHWSERMSNILVALICITKKEIRKNRYLCWRVEDSLRETIELSVVCAIKES